MVRQLVEYYVTDFLLQSFFVRAVTLFQCGLIVAHSALKSGMVYFCAWGPDCERFHGIVDEVVVEDDIGERLFFGKNRSDTIMTTWHDDEPLNEALDFFVNLTCPTAGSTIQAVLCLWSPSQVRKRFGRGSRPRPAVTVVKDTSQRRR